MLAALKQEKIRTLLAKSQKPSPGVLGDHKRVGKKFIPPFIAQIGPIAEILWANDLVPELLWLGMLNAEHGLKVGAELARQLALAAVGARGTKPKRWFALTSAYEELDVTERLGVVAALQPSGVLAQIRQALRPFPIFYPLCPLNFLYDAPPAATEDLLAEFKNVLESIFDRWGNAATFAQANAIYIAFTSDMLKVFKGLALANFPAVEEFPHTAESQRVASGVRSAVSAFYGNLKDEHSAAWITYFWNRGLELEPCSLTE